MAGDSRPSLQERYGNTTGYVSRHGRRQSARERRLMLASDAPGNCQRESLVPQASNGMP
jgi:hypothetical protein